MTADEWDSNTVTVVYLTIPLRRPTATVWATPSLKPWLNPAWREASSPASTPSTYPSCPEQGHDQLEEKRLTFSQQWEVILTVTAVVYTTVTLCVVNREQVEEQLYVTLPSHASSCWRSTLYSGGWGRCHSRQRHLPRCRTRLWTRTSSPHCGKKLL